MKSDRFKPQSGHLVQVQVPQSALQSVLDAIYAVDPLSWGDYDHVSFASATGEQRFRGLGTGRNAATDGVLTVYCTELSFFVGGDVVPVIEAIYSAHPYEEPVIFVQPVTRCTHVAGQDEDNPNRIWNRTEPPDWLKPEE